MASGRGKDASATQSGIASTTTIAVACLILRVRTARRQMAVRREDVERRTRMAVRWAIDVYAWDPGEFEWAYLLSILPPDERERISRFVFRDDQKRALASRLMQRRCAHEALGLQVDAAAVPIGRTKGGKPFVKASVARPESAPNFNFNVSHEGAWVVLASDPLLLVGVDVAAPESARRRRALPAQGAGEAPRGKTLEELFSSMSNSLSPSEWAFVRAQPSEREQEGAFRRLWSCKEAFIKARGDGLAFSPLARAEFGFGGGEHGGTSPASEGAASFTATLRVDGVAQPEWSFLVEHLPTDHWVSVARGPPTAAVDAWGEFVATMARPRIESERAAAALREPPPRWEIRQVGALLPPNCFEGYAHARAEDRALSVSGSDP
jgi:4'-phosphopantetheinyl transferase